MTSDSDFTPPEASDTEASEQLSEWNTREGDLEQDLPKINVVCRDVSPEELQRQEEYEQAKEKRLSAAKVANGDDTWLYDRLSSYFRWGKNLLIAAGLFLGFIALSQILMGLATVMSVPGSVGYVLGEIYLAFLLLIFAVVGRMAYSLYSLPRYNFTLDKATFDSQLNQRLALQKIEDSQRIRDELRRYLREHPLFQEASAKSLLKDEKRKELEKAKEYLLEVKGLDAKSWVVEFHTKFQNPLNEIAKKEVENFATKAGFGTAISRDSLLDRIIILSSIVGMFKCLLELYGLRPKLANTLPLLSAALTHTYIAGYTQELAQNMTEQAFADFGNKLTNTLGAKVAEGGIHYFTVKRLGLIAIKLLAPPKLK